MLHKAVHRHFFKHRAWLSVIAIRVDGDAATWCEFGPHFDIPDPSVQLGHS